MECARRYFATATTFSMPTSGTHEFCTTNGVRGDTACMRHVAAHRDIEMNERADSLANMGRRGESRDGAPSADPVIIAD